ncbi:hypothetical protein [Fimbriiglobus ruber]|uniref:hypothetical protein n=1 Tax=Fimbriiglobus ruber TaxID=1908690 RepID=UPI00117AAB55|nr:hypothetical protein [Fimbriiglobus ruber]
MVKLDCTCFIELAVVGSEDAIRDRVRNPVRQYCALKSCVFDREALDSAGSAHEFSEKIIIRQVNDGGSRAGLRLNGDIIADLNASIVIAGVRARGNQNGITVGRGVHGAADVLVVRGHTRVDDQGRGYPAMFERLDAGPKFRVSRMRIASPHTGRRELVIEPTSPH